MNDPLVIAGKGFQSRLMVGTGRHRSMEEMVQSIEASGAEMVTVAFRRVWLRARIDRTIYLKPGGACSARVFGDEHKRCSVTAS